MGLSTRILQPFYKLSGTQGQEVHLNAVEILIIVEDCASLVEEHFDKTIPDNQGFPKSELVSNQHKLIFSFYKEKPTIIVAKRPEPVFNNVSLPQRRISPQRAHEVCLAKASWVQLRDMLPIIRTMTHRYNMFSGQAPAWLRNFAESVVASGGSCYRDPQPMPETEQVIMERYYTDNCFQSSWRDVLQTEYIEKKKDPTEIKFLEEMCTVTPYVVKEELLKVRNTPEFYAKVSYHTDPSLS